MGYALHDQLRDPAEVLEMRHSGKHFERIYYIPLTLCACTALGQRQHCNSFGGMDPGNTSTNMLIKIHGFGVYFKVVLILIATRRWQTLL